MICDKAAMEWLIERRDNCKRIAAEKLPGEDRMGWELDAHYFQRAIDMIQYYHDAYVRTLDEHAETLRSRQDAVSRAVSRPKR
jgi:hypothetical protein